MSIETEEKIEPVTLEEAKEPTQPITYSKPSIAPTRPRNRSRRWLVVTALLIVPAVAVGLWLWRRHPNPVPGRTEAAQPQTVDLVVIDNNQMSQVSVEAVDRRMMSSNIETTGKVAFNEDRLTPVFAPYAGRATEMLANKGDNVKAGQPLLALESPDLVNAETQFTQAKSDLAKAKIGLNAAQVAADRAKRLHDREAIATKDLQQAETDLARAEDDDRRAKAALSMSESILALFGKSPDEIAQIGAKVDRRLMLRAPIAGTIVERKIGTGQYVQASAPDPLFLISDLSTLWIQADVFESDLPNVRVGAPVEVSVPAFPNRTFPAHISFISPTLDPTTRTVRVRCLVTNNDHALKPEMFARIKIESATQAAAIVVPSSAIISQGNDSLVYVEESPGHFRKRQIHVKREAGGYVEIKDGLQLGERVATRGGLLLNELNRPQG